MDAIVQNIKNILDNQSYPATVQSNDFHILYANKAARKMFGPCEAEDRPKCFQFLHGLEKPPSSCYCGNGSSEIKITRVLEPSAIMAFEHMYIPICVRNKVLCSLNILKDIPLPANVRAGKFPVVLEETDDTVLSGDSLLERLTDKEKNILYWIKQGRSTAEISSIMGISKNTVNFHLKNIFNKLGAANRARTLTLVHKKELEHKDLIIKEIHHRVMNNFHVLNSIINIKSKDIHDSDTAAIFSNISLLIKGFSSFHRAMIPSGDSPCVSASLFIGKSLDDFSGAFKRSDCSIVIEHEIDDIQIKTDIALTCMQIISEMVSNSIKHAFKNKRGGKISVRLSLINDDFCREKKNIRVEVKDNGIGFPDSCLVFKGNSNGMRIVSALANQIGSDIKVDTGKGACLSFDFKDSSQC